MLFINVLVTTDGSLFKGSHRYSSTSYGEIVKALVEAKANITLTTRKGQTARDLAVSKGYHKIIDMLSTDPKFRKSVELYLCDPLNRLPSVVTIWLIQIQSSLGLLHVQGEF